MGCAQNSSLPPQAALSGTRPRRAGESECPDSLQASHDSTLMSLVHARSSEGGMPAAATSSRAIVAAEDDSIRHDSMTYASGGRIQHLEVFNFKSYGGTRTIGPFLGFTAVVGPPLHVVACLSSSPTAFGHICPSRRALPTTNSCCSSTRAHLSPRPQALLEELSLTLGHDCNGCERL